MKYIFLSIITLFIFGICDFIFSNKVSLYLVNNDIFFDDHLQEYKQQKLNDNSARQSGNKLTCEIHKVFYIYRYKTCFEVQMETSKGDIIKFIYYEPTPLLFSLTGTEFLRESYYGEHLKTLTANYTVIYSKGYDG